MANACFTIGSCCWRWRCRSPARVPALLLGSQAPQAEEVCHGSSTLCTLDTTLTYAQRLLQASPVASRPLASPRTRPSPRRASRPVVLRPLASNLPPGGELKERHEKESEGYWFGFGTGFLGDME